MRLTLDPRLRAWARRLPVTNFYSLAELLLLVVLAVQCARLLWTLVTPVGPIGDWRPASGVSAGDPAQAARLRTFDPFFRLVDTGTATVLTSLQLVLYGTRVDEATGRGSAILGPPEGVQNSYAIGDEVVPGVILSGVAFDHVTLTRGGAEETLFIDQSNPAPVADASGAPAALGAAPAATVPAAAPVDPRRAGPPPLTIETIRRDIRFTPRTVDGQRSGVAVTGTTGSPTLGQAGLVDGDVILEAGGRPVSGSADIEAAAAGVQPGTSLPLVVERGGQRVPIAVPVRQ
ncbi:general secretion pathway protein C [Sphingomonas jejuensis]|uniref:General secretion pathway protein C n=1 Tax=Sphingomonas jejuensis TaxID=904715 RepID=A0ABX0XJE2_9SPHN|nr:type II secretion system protein N [Sphingomonas jejuensis]NJC33278.1 general secretion pathway protein C [Sphingomonas jejuensis]